MSKPEPFTVGYFGPWQDAVNLLADLANDATSAHQAQASLILEQWRSALATDAQYDAAYSVLWQDSTMEYHFTFAKGAAVIPVDDETDKGFLIQVWGWVPDTEDEE